MMREESRNRLFSFIVNGIKSMIGKVGEAVSSVADKIRSFLHFSVPDEGPLTYIDGYQVKLVSDTSYGSLWEVSFTLKEF